ncbi:MAG: plasmid recombination protein [Lachnospiraceae bacterium]|nr:plasmid recombination protein [Lachnospiraceae bacterium]
MARVVKYQVRAVGHLIAHYERRQELNEKTGEMEYVKFGNRDIDPKWTPLNYRVWPPLEESVAYERELFQSEELLELWRGVGTDSEEPSLKRFRRIFDNTPHAKRRDLNCFCEWVISLPDEIPVERMQEFFDLCMRYCVHEYGAENMVGGWVHVDEDHRPHLHVAFVPVVTDKDGNKRICAKDLIDRKHLSGWHGGLTAVLQKAMDIENPGILNGKTAAQGGNRTVKQMKASDKAYARSKGKEVDRYRKSHLKPLTGTQKLENLVTDAEERKNQKLIQPSPSRKSFWRSSRN